MGQIFSELDEKYNQPFSEFNLKLKKVSLKDIFESIELIHVSYPNLIYLYYEQFDDVFGGLTELYTDIFNILAEPDEKDILKANTFETLVCFGIFCGETYESKCQFIFHLFDFDCSGCIDIDELTLILQNVCITLCKISKIKIPSLEILHSISELCLQMMDQDRNNYIDYDEFYQWTSENEQLQKFLFHLSGTLTYWYAKKRMNFRMISAEESFVQTSNKLGFDGNVIPAKNLYEHLFGYYKNQPREWLLQLYGIILDITFKLRVDKNTGTKLTYELLKQYSSSQQENLLKEYKLHRLDYLDVIRAWEAFDSCDPNGQGFASTSEVKVILWTVDDHEPDYFKVNYTQQEMDPNHKGTITKSEWLNYLWQQDIVSKEYLYSGRIRKIFDQYDFEQVGLISTSLAKNAILDVFKEQLQQFKQLRYIDKCYQIIEKIINEFQKQLKEKDLQEFNFQQFNEFLKISTSKYPLLSQLNHSSQR